MLESHSKGGGISFLTLLALLFIGLKLGKVIAWPWWQVLLPIWGPLALFIVIGCVVVLLAAILGEPKKNRHRI